MKNYQFSNHWFLDNQAAWDAVLSECTPQKILEIGAYEGQGTCYWIDSLAPRTALEIHCVDTWQGGIEHQANGTAATDMSLVLQRFQNNCQMALAQTAHPVNVVIHQALSHHALTQLRTQAQHCNSFDLIYVDGSHQAPDVLSDAVLAFGLLKVGGLMVFDDYLWHEEALGQQDILNMPKMAVDAFVNIYQRKLRVLFGKPNNQVFVQKIAE